MTPPADGGDAAANGDDGSAATDGGHQESARSLTMGREQAVASDVAVPSSTVSLDQIRAVARREYRVLARARWHYGLALLFAVFSLAVVGLADTTPGHADAGAMVLTLAELSVYLVPLAALALGYGTVVGAAERGTLELLLALPLARRDVLVGKFAGRAVAFAVGTTLGLGVGVLLVAVRYGVAVIPAYLHYLVTAVIVGVVFLAIGVCISAVAREKAHALGGVLLAWVWFVFVYDLLAFGVVVTINPPDWILPLLVIGNPTAVLRLVALSLVPESAGGIAASLLTTALPLWGLVGALLVWTIAPLAVGGWLLGRRS